MPEPERDEPFYVPEEFERDHLVDAKRTVARSTRAQRPHRTLMARRPSTQRGRTRLVVTAIHLLATLLLVALAALTETWLIAAALLAVVAVSLLVSLRLVDVAQQAQVTEPQQR